MLERTELVFENGKKISNSLEVPHPGFFFAWIPQNPCFVNFQIWRFLEYTPENHHGSYKNGGLENDFPYIFRFQPLVFGGFRING